MVVEGPVQVRRLSPLLGPVNMLELAQPREMVRALEDMSETPSSTRGSGVPAAVVTAVGSRFEQGLLDFHQIGAAINRLTPRGYSGADRASVEGVLRLIADSVLHVVPDAIAIIHAYNAEEQAFDPASQILAGESADAEPHEPPRGNGLGLRAMRQQQRVLSYDVPDVSIHPRALQAGARAVGCFPLIVSGQPVGVLYVYLRETDRFDTSSLLLIDTLANYAAMAIQQGRRLSDAEHDLARSEEAVNRLWRAGMLISSRLGLDETLEAILQMALDVTGAHHGIFRLVSDDGKRLVTRAIAGAPGRPQMGDMPIDGASVMGWVAAHGTSLCIHDLEAAPWVRLYHPLDADLKMRSELAVPLTGAGGRLEGVLNLESPLVGAFDDPDRHLLQSLATQAVIAIQEARLLDALLEAARLIQVESYPSVYQRLVAQASDLLNASVSAIWLLEGEELVLQATTGVGTPGPSEQSGTPERGDRLPLQGSLTGRAVLDRAPVTSEDLRADHRFYRADLAESQAWTRALIVPLLSSDDAATDGRGAAVGAFSVYGVGVERGSFAESEWDKKVLTCLAYYATLAYQNAEHQRALRLAEERHAVAETFAAAGDVAANVLHHLNNKVGTIPARVQGIQDKCGPSLARDAYLAANIAAIERSAREAMDAVQESLATLRPINPSSVVVAECVSAALDAVHLPVAIVVETVALGDLPPVVASQRSLVFVFTNLLENAAAALQGGGTITIRGQARGAWVEIEVEDDGPGIAAELHERIFELDAPGQAPRRNGSLGFGLWWVKTLLMRLGGSVKVESDGHRGTRFTLVLPRSEVGREG